MLTIGFTIGVFDLLHKGHTTHIIRALQHCDLLIVAVVDDYHVKMQKGLDRPVEPLEARLNKLKSRFPYCKFITFDSLTVSPQLMDLVDVAFPGPDQLDKFYSHPDNQFKSHIIIPRTEGVSTTSIIASQRLSDAPRTSSDD